MLAEARRILALSLPMIAVQVGNMTMGVVDALIVGRAGTHALAGMALGHVWLWGTLMIANGVVMGVDPLMSQAHGAREPGTVALAFQRGVVFAAAVSIPLSALWLLTEPALAALGQDPTLARDAGRFVAVQAPTAAAFLIFAVNRQYLGARSIGVPIVLVVLLANVFNAVLCWGFVFGHLGLPTLGLLGAGISQGAARLFMGVVLWAVTFGFGLHREAWIPWSRASIDLGALGRIAVLGAPLGLQFGLEAWAFQITALLAGKLGKDSLAANTIVINLAALSFMVPLGLSLGASIRIGHLIGSGEPLAARRSAIVSLALGAGVMSISAAAFLVFRGELPRLYGATPEVCSIATSVFPIAAAFQLFDGTQVVGAAILRGMGRTRPAALLNLVGYYALALPLGWVLAFPLGGGLRGLWWGLVLGLGVVALGVLPLAARRRAFEGLGRAESPPAG
jgi:MATE family multidrug resistance protein